MAGFNINAFTSDIRTRGIVRTNSFLVYVEPPKLLRGLYKDASKIIIRCDGASLPSSSLMKYELYRYGYGVQESSPYSVQFEPINLSFIMDSQAEIYSFFYKWMNLIVNYNMKGGLDQQSQFGLRPYEVGYKDNYKALVKIAIFNEAADSIIEVTLLDAYPNSLSDVPLNWATNDEIVRINVPMYYRDFFIETITPVQLQEKYNILSSTVSNINASKPAVVNSLLAELQSPLITTTDFVDRIIPFTTIK